MPLTRTKALSRSSSIHDSYAVQKQIKHALPFARFDKDAFAIHYLHFLQGYVMIPSEINYITKEMDVKSLQNLYDAGYPHESVVFRLAQLSFDDTYMSDGNVFMVKKLKFINTYIKKRVSAMAYTMRKKKAGASHYYQGSDCHDSTVCVCVEENRPHPYGMLHDFDNHIRSMRFFTNINRNEYDMFIQNYQFSQSELAYLHRARGDKYAEYNAHVEKVRRREKHTTPDSIFKHHNAIDIELHRVKQPILDELYGRFPDGWYNAQRMFLERQQDQQELNVYQEAYFVDLITEIEEGERQFSTELKRGRTLLFPRVAT